MSYQQEKKIGFLDLGAKEEIRLTALIKHINEVSGYSGELIGAGMKETLKFGMVFVLQRLGIQIFSMPKLDDILTIKTWPGEMARSAFKRQGEILNSAGQKVIEWESIWVLIDVNARKMKRPTDYPKELPVYGRQGVEIEAEKVRIPEEAEKLASYKHIVRYSELDMYGHMNSAIYADLVANVLAKVGKQSIENAREVQFNYINEAKLDDEILVECRALEDEIYILGTSGEASVFTAEIK